LAGFRFALRKVQEQEKDIGAAHPAGVYCEALSGKPTEDAICLCGRKNIFGAAVFLLFKLRRGVLY